MLPAMAVRDCMNYALSLPIHCITLGFTSVGQVDDDVRFACEHEKLSAEAMEELRARGARLAGPQFENWKRPFGQQTALRGIPPHDDV